MSDYESHSGRLKKVVPMEKESFEQLCKRLWIKNEMPEDEYEEGELFSEFYEKYFNVNGVIWEAIEHEDHGEEDDMFCRLHENADGTITFHTRFYNGGTGLSEMIEDAISEHESEKQTT